MKTWKGLLCVLPAVWLAYLGQKQSNDAFMAIIVACAVVVFLGFAAQLTIFLGFMILTMGGEIDEEFNPKHPVMKAAMIGFIYVTLILTLFNGWVYKGDREESFGDLLDRSATQLKDRDMPVTVPNLKKAMRWAEQQQREEDAEQRDEFK